MEDTSKNERPRKRGDEDVELRYDDDSDADDGSDNDDDDYDDDKKDDAVGDGDCLTGSQARVLTTIAATTVIRQISHDTGQRRLLHHGGRWV